MSAIQTMHQGLSQTASELRNNLRNDMLEVMEKDKTENDKRFKAIEGRLQRLETARAQRSSSASPPLGGSAAQGASSGLAKASARSGQFGLTSSAAANANLPHVHSNHNNAEAHSPEANVWKPRCIVIGGFPKGLEGHDPGPGGPHPRCIAWEALAAPAGPLHATTLRRDRQSESFQRR